MKRLLLVLALLSTAAGCSSNEGGGPAPGPANTTSSSPTTTSPASTTEPATPPDEISAPVETTAYSEPTQPAYTAPAEPVVVLGEQCFSRGATATTNDGSTAYCSRQAGWGKNIWSLTPGVAANPELQDGLLETGMAILGDVCYDDSATTTDAQGRTLYCNPQVDGEYPGSALMWYLEP